MSPDLPATMAPSSGTAPNGQVPDLDYWHGLIGEREAARFLNLSVRTLQGFRYRGGGPRYFRLSSRCLKYRRVDCRAWCEVRMRSSTSDPGLETAD